jgi:hypothetical protein
MWKYNQSQQAVMTQENYFAVFSARFILNCHRHSVLWGLNLF